MSKLTAMQWVKLEVDMFQNRKLRYIKHLERGNELCLLWVQLLCLAGQSGTSGELWLSDDIPYDFKMLAIDLGFDKELVELGIETFTSLGMIEVINNVLLISGWEEHQAVDKLEKTREQTRLRVQKHRAKQTCNVTCNADVTQCNADVTQQSKSKSKSKKECVSCNNLSVVTEGDQKIFAGDTPTLSEVESFFGAEGLNGNPELFWAHYDAVGWVDANGNAIANWRSLAKKWSLKELGLTSEPPGEPSAEQLRSELVQVEKRLETLQQNARPSSATTTTTTPLELEELQLSTRRKQLLAQLEKAG